MLRDTKTSWGAVTKSLHWLIALLVLANFALGWTARAWSLSPAKLALFSWHKTIGITVLTLVLVRIAWRSFQKTPAPPAGVPGWERLAARVSHVLLYALLIAMPLSGWLVHSSSTLPVTADLVGGIELPALAGRDEALYRSARGWHLILFWAFAAAAALHAGAALRHHFFKRNAILRRMLPFGSRQ